MPRYTYQFVDTEETIEVYQSMSDDTLTELAHPETDEVMKVKKNLLGSSDKWLCSQASNGKSYISAR